MVADYRPITHDHLRTTASIAATIVIAATAQRRRLQPVICGYLVMVADYRPTTHDNPRTTASTAAATAIAAAAQRRRLQPVIGGYFVMAAYCQLLLMLVLEQHLVLRLLL